MKYKNAEEQTSIVFNAECFDQYKASVKPLMICQTDYQAAKNAPHIHKLVNSKKFEANINTINKSIRAAAEELGHQLIGLT